MGLANLIASWGIALPSTLWSACTVLWSMGGGGRCTSWPDSVARLTSCRAGICNLFKGGTCRQQSKLWAVLLPQSKLSELFHSLFRCADFRQGCGVCALRWNHDWCNGSVIRWNGDWRTHGCHLRSLWHAELGHRHGPTVLRLIHVQPSVCAVLTDNGGGDGTPPNLLFGAWLHFRNFRNACFKLSRWHTLSHRRSDAKPVFQVCSTTRCL